MTNDDLLIQKKEEQQRPFLELPVPEPTRRKIEEPKREPKRVIIIDTLDDDCEDFTIDL